MGGRYDRMESNGISGSDVSLPTNWTAEDVESWLMIHVAAVNDNTTVDPDADLFAQGFDRWVDGKPAIALC